MRSFSSSSARAASSATLPHSSRFLAHMARLMYSTDQPGDSVMASVYFCTSMEGGQEQGVQL